MLAVAVLLAQRAEHLMADGAVHYEVVLIQVGRCFQNSGAVRALEAVDQGGFPRPDRRRLGGSRCRCSGGRRRRRGGLFRSRFRQILLWYIRHSVYSHSSIRSFRLEPVSDCAAGWNHADPLKPSAAEQFRDRWPVPVRAGPTGLNPFERTLFPYPHVAEHQDAEENQHL